MKTLILVGGLFVSVVSMGGTDFIGARKPFLNGVKAANGTVAGAMTVAFSGTPAPAPKAPPGPRTAPIAAPAPVPSRAAAMAPGAQILTLDSVGMKACGNGKWVGPGEGC